MTLPNLIGNHRKKITEAKLKETYSILEQAFRMAEAKHGFINDWPEWENADTIFTKYIVPELKVGKNFGIGGAWNKAMCSDKSKSYQYKWMTANSVSPGGSYHISLPFNANTSSIKLVNGACIGLNPITGSYSSNIFVDIDGPNHGRNIAGYDLFFFYINDKNQIRPYGDTWTDEQIATNNAGCNKKGTVTGFVCASKIMRENWQINYW